MLSGSPLAGDEVMYGYDSDGTGGTGSATRRTTSTARTGSCARTVTPPPFDHEEINRLNASVFELKQQVDDQAFNINTRDQQMNSTKLELQEKTEEVNLLKNRYESTTRENEILCRRISLLEDKVRSANQQAKELEVQATDETHLLVGQVDKQQDYVKKSGSWRTKIIIIITATSLLSLGIGFAVGFWVL